MPAGLGGRSVPIMRKVEVKAGDKFDRLTAVSEAEPDEGGNQRWLFRCLCGQSVTWRVTTAARNVRKYLWCSCPDCYQAMGRDHVLANKRLNGKGWLKRLERL